MDYRVIKKTVVGICDTTEYEETVWQGSDLKDLNEKHPRSEIMGADSLGRSEIDDGLIIMTCRFEQSEDGKNWTICEDDPRRVRGISEMTEFEAAVDAENRQRYPGDYLEEEDEEDDWNDRDDHDDEELDQDWISPEEQALYPL